MEEKPNYFAVIPANVRYDDELKLGEKMMYGEITALTSKTGECWASNNYFSKLYNVTPQAISKWIKTLEDKKYIVISYQKNGKAIIKRIIKMISTPIDRVSTDIDRGINHSLEGYQPEIKENNTSINNTSINNNTTTNIYDFVEINFGRTLNPIEYEEISKWEDSELTRYAIKQAILKNKYSIKYISTILNNYQLEHIITVAQAQESTKNYINKKSEKKESQWELAERLRKKYEEEEK